MPIKTLEEYLKQTTPTTTEQQATKPKYRLTGFYKEMLFQETPIGKIPKQWKIVKLYEISDKIKAGGTPRVSKKEYWNGNIPFVKIEDLAASRKYLYSTKTFITELGLEKSNAWIVPEESLLLAMYGSMGEVAINEIKVATNQAILGIIPRRGITHVEYLYYWFLYFKPKWRIYAKWTTQPNLTAKIVKNSYVPLPPLEEQWGIAEVLSSVDEAIEATKRLIGRLERLKRGLMQELLTKGIGHKEYKQTPIGKIPKQWQVVKLSRIASIIMGQSPPSSTYNEKGVGLPFLQGKTEFGRMYPKPVMYTSKPIKIAEREDLLISVRAPVGAVNIAPFKLCIGRGLASIRFNRDRASTLFYFYYFQLSKPRLEAMGKGSTFKAITKKDLENLLVPLPLLNEQDRIANTLKAVDDWISAEEKRKVKFERLKRGLMEVLLTGRVRVRVASGSSG